jgi:hypothetical protein
MSNIVTAADQPSDSDVNLGILNIRVDSTTQSLHVSTTGVTIDIVYSVKVGVPGSHTLSSTSGLVNSLSTTPVELYSSVLDSVDKFAEIRIFNKTHLNLFFVTVVCTYSDPLYAVCIFKAH